MSKDKTYLVSFWVHDCYRIALDAATEDEALAKAEALYAEAGDAAFDLDITIGGTDDWQAEEVRS